MFREWIGDFKEKNTSLIISYLSLRQLIGWLGMLLPLICVGGGFLFSKLPLQPSISAYYHTNMRDFFVGLMICVSFFLVTYKGYERIDKRITTLIGIAGFGIAVFPCLDSGTSTRAVGIFQLSSSLSDKIHIGCALIFFILLAINSIFLFTLGQDPKKNSIYRICGIVILSSIILLAIGVVAINDEVVKKMKIVLALETVMLWAFGISWLVKGKTLENLAELSVLLKEKTQQYLSEIKRLVKKESVK
ncbi:MAG: hypothetical protein HY787_09990 [Deltaproteobacteria bacterium]|nr:hypothetical protein [Deltaproteobacteria bacterium]